MIEAYNLSRIINKSLTGYDRKVRPNAGGPPVIVKIEFKVISFGEIKEANMVSFGTERYHLQGSVQTGDSAINHSHNITSNLMSFKRQHLELGFGVTVNSLLGFSLYHRSMKHT